MLKYRLITALILIPAVIAALFFLPLLGFSLVTLAVCMLAAWEWGQLAGFVSYSQRIWLALLFGLLLAVMLLTMPAYQRSVHVVQIAASLWSSAAWWCLALVMVLSYPASALAWRHSRILRLVAGMLTIIPFFWGMVTLRQLGYEANSFTGAWWLLYVMLLVWGADSG
uniref:phosphatidate cytidylyltransferase n=1 Tax=Lonsdalea britannica TaxID=1082704 RepID=UPI0026EB4C3F